MAAHRRLDHAAAITVHAPFATVHHARSTTVVYVHAAHSLNHHPSPTEARPVVQKVPRSFPHSPLFLRALTSEVAEKKIKAAGGSIVLIA
ncbi:hypothetical protein ABZP36_002070 [Zizania latifolia]